MQIKAKIEENKCFSSESRGFKKYVLMGLGLATGGYIVSDSIFYLDGEHDAIIVNRLWKEKKLIEEEGFHFKLPILESKCLIRNLYNIDLMNLMASELRESINLNFEYKLNLPSIQEMMEVYKTSSKEELYQRMWDDISFFLIYGILSPELEKILTIYLGNLVEKYKVIEPFLNKNFNVINGHYNNRFSVEFYDGLGHARYESNTNTIKIPYSNVFQTFLYSLEASDPKFLEAIMIEYNEETLSQLYAAALMGEAQLIETLVHESIHAQFIREEDVTQVLTHLALAESTKIDKDFELYAKASIYLNLLNTLGLLGMKNLQEIKGINLPSKKMREEFHAQYTIEWYKQIAMGLLTDNQLFIPEKKITIDISSLKPYFSKLEELRG